MLYEGRIHMKQEDGITDLIQLNELELITDPLSGHEYLWGHLYQTNWIIKLDLRTGIVIKRINLKIL